MARAQQAKGRGFATPLRVSLPAGLRLDISEAALKRAIPVLILIFVVFLTMGVAVHRYRDHNAALASASAELALFGDLIARNVAAERGASAPIGQRELARALPRHASDHGRIVLYADPSGQVQASSPIETPYSGRPLISLLGPDQPMTMLGAGAGVMRIGLTDGADVLATVRTLDKEAGQIALLQPIGGALAPWRNDTYVLMSLLTTTVMVVILIGLAFKWQTVRGETAEGALARMTERLDRALIRGRCGLWDWDLSRGQVFWSRSMLDILGLDRAEEVLPFGMVADLMHPDDGDLYAFANSLVRGEQAVVDLEFRMRHASGDWVWLRARAELIENPSDPGPRLVGIAVDVTEQKQIAAASHTADIRLRDAIENISEAFVLWDPDNRLVMCNSKYQQFYRLPNGVVAPGTRYEEVVAAAQEPMVRTRLDVAGNREGSSTFEAQLEDRRWLHISERRTRDGGFVSVGTDITPLKEHEARLVENEHELMDTVANLEASQRTLERQAQQLVDLAEKYQSEKTRAEAANQSKSEFLANMSHELRTPLNAIIGFSEIMQAELFGDMGSEKYKEYARDIHESGQYLLDVINDILDMSKIEAGRIALAPKQLEITQLVTDSLRIIAARAEESGISLINEVTDPVEIRGDRRALKQILLNLISNAVKFTEEGGEVRVRASHDKATLTVSIADTGVGIPPEEVEKLGRPFEQVETQLTKSHRGSGLGLAISRSLVELHGGRLSIESELGVGTTVAFTIPFEPATTSEPAAA